MNNVRDGLIGSFRSLCLSECDSSHLVHQQLNYSGVLEVVRIRREVRAFLDFPA